MVQINLSKHFLEELRESIEESEGCSNSKLVSLALKKFCDIRENLEIQSRDEINVMEILEDANAFFPGAISYDSVKLERAIEYLLQRK